MIVITTVHGTWGRGMFCPSRDAPWTEDDSRVCKAFRDKWGTDVKFRRFNWSGGNSHTARLQAATDLSQFLVDGIEEFPDSAKHLIVAHSHGGNVSLLALKKSSVHEKIAGLACLATPFISVQERGVGVNAWKTYIISLLILFPFLYWLIDSLFAQHEGSLVYVREATKILASGVLFAIGLHLAVGAKRFSKILADTLTPFSPQKEQLFIVRSPGDEASGALSIFQFISQLTVRIFLVIQSAADWIEERLISLANRKKLLFGVAIISFVVFLLSVIRNSELLNSNEASLAYHVTLIAYLAALIVCFVTVSLLVPFIGGEKIALVARAIPAAILWPVIVVLSLLLLAPFGWQAAVANIFLDVSADSTPVGDWEIRMVSPVTSHEQDQSMPALKHMIYENPSAVSKLCDWASKINGEKLG